MSETSVSSASRIVVAGSIAFDTIMVFKGYFGDHILADKTHEINVSFNIDEVVSRPGGNAANIAYTLALLGEHPILAGGVGKNFATRTAELAELGVDVSNVLEVDTHQTAAAYITTDLKNDQITAFYPGAMMRADEIDVSTIADAEYVVLTPDAPNAISRHIKDAIAMNTRLMFSPGQVLTALDDETLLLGVESAWLLICNDYEMSLIEKRLNLTAPRLGESRNVIVTEGEAGAMFYTPSGSFRVPAAPVASVVDPTGAGDAYLAGLIHGLRQENGDLVRAGNYASAAAAFCVEVNGTQEHSFTPETFAARLDSAAVA